MPQLRRHSRNGGKFAGIYRALESLGICLFKFKYRPNFFYHRYGNWQAKPKLIGRHELHVMRFSNDYILWIRGFLSLAQVHVAGGIKVINIGSK